VTSTRARALSTAQPHVTLETIDISYYVQINDIFYGLGLTQRRTAVNDSRMGRPPLKFKVTPIVLRLPSAVAARLKTALGEGETRTDFIRHAVETELKKREKKGGRK
jgi:hypothetical protein